MSRRPTGRIDANYGDRKTDDVMYHKEGDNVDFVEHRTETTLAKVDATVPVGASLMGSCMSGGAGSVIAVVILFIIIWIVIWLIIWSIDHESFQKKDCNEFDSGRGIFAAFIITIILFIIFWLIAYVARAW